MTISVLVPWRHAVRYHQWLITAPTDHALFCVGGFPQVPVVDDSLSSCYKHNTISHVLFICTINCSYWINTSITIYVMFCYYSKMFEVLIEKIHFYYLILFDKYYTTKILPIWCKTLNNQSINMIYWLYIGFCRAQKIMETLHCCWRAPEWRQARIQKFFPVGSNLK